MSYGGLLQKNARATIRHIFTSSEEHNNLSPFGERGGKKENKFYPLKTSRDNNRIENVKHMHFDIELSAAEKIDFPLLSPLVNK